MSGQTRGDLPYTQADWSGVGQGIGDIFSRLFGGGSPVPRAPAPATGPQPVAIIPRALQQAPLPPARPSLATSAPFPPARRPPTSAKRRQGPIPDRAAVAARASGHGEQMTTSSGSPINPSRLPASQEKYPDTDALAAQPSTGKPREKYADTPDAPPEVMSRAFVDPYRCEGVGRFDR
jgi:hypothetical protein